MSERIGWRAIARYLAGESTPGEAAAVEAWAHADARHADILESARRTWASAEPAEKAFDTDRGWSRLSARMPHADSNRERARARSDRLWRGRVMRASGLIAAGIAVALLVPMTSSRRDVQPRFVTRSNTVITAHLSDGSVVRLAPRSQLRVGARGAREAWLEGTAFFAIAHRNGEAFVVHTRGGDARVLGTRFELSTRTNEVRLIVFEGRVALTARGHSEIVPAGQVSFASSTRAPAPPRQSRARSSEPWLEGVLIFQATPLSNVARELQTMYHVPVHVVDSALAGRTVSGTFDHQPLQSVAAAVCRVVDATCEVTDSAVLIHD